MAHRDNAVRLLGTALHKAQVDVLRSFNGFATRFKYL